ncbi:MAG: hypothetical protein ACFNO7_06780 [Bacteroides sp.]
MRYEFYVYDEMTTPYAKFRLLHQTTWQYVLGNSSPQSARPVAQGN